MSLVSIWLACIAPAVLSNPVTDASLQSLSNQLTGTIALPGTPLFQSKQRVHWEIFNNQSPRAIACPSTVDDVTLIAKYLASTRFPFRVRSGGHSYGGYSQCDSKCIVIDMSSFNRIRSEGRGIYYIESGVTTDKLSKLNIIPHGSYPTVAMGGFIQGGGIGFLSSKFGLSSDHVVEVLVVMEDGTPIWIDGDSEFKDLFHAIRGSGGGGWGIVIGYKVKARYAYDSDYLYYTGTISWRLHSSNARSQMDAAFSVLDRFCGGDMSCQLTLKPDSQLVAYEFVLKYVFISDRSPFRRNYFSRMLSQMRGHGQTTSTGFSEYSSPSSLYESDIFPHSIAVHSLGANSTYIVPASRLSFDTFSDNSKFLQKLYDFMCVYASLSWNGVAFVVDVQRVLPRKFSKDQPRSAFAAYNALYSVQFYAHAMSGTAEDKQVAMRMVEEMETNVLSLLGNSVYVNYFSKPIGPVSDPARVTNQLYGTDALYKKLQRVKDRYDVLNFFRFEYSVFPFPWDDDESSEDLGEPWRWNEEDTRPAEPYRRRREDSEYGWTWRQDDKRRGRRGRP